LFLPLVTACGSGKSAPVPSSRASQAPLSQQCYTLVAGASRDRVQAQVLVEMVQKEGNGEARTSDHPPDFWNRVYQIWIKLPIGMSVDSSGVLQTAVQQQCDQAFGAS
jgi:hypothetical protein